MQDNTADVILIYPKTGMDIGSTVAPPHSLLAISAPFYKEGYKIRIIDQRVDPHWKHNLSKALESGPICVGISCMTGTQIYFALESAKLVRRYTNYKIPIIWGGPHPSILPQQTLENENVDIVCIGEGDVTFLELVSALQSRTPLENIQGIAFKDGTKNIITPPRPLLDVETLLPVPWDLIDINNYIHTDFYLKKSYRSLDIGQTSRGCPFQCGFCSSAAIRHRKYRAMSSERSLDAIAEPVKRFSLDGIWIRDDEFYIDRERVEKICEGIIRLGLKINWYTSGTRVDMFNRYTDRQIELLKRSGAYVLKFGAESGSNRILGLINKGIKKEDTLAINLRVKKHGIIPAYSLMVGFPTETFDEINETIDLAIKLVRDNPHAQLETIATYTALPGTPLYDLALEMELKPPESLSGWINWIFDDYDLKGEKIPWFNYRDRKKIGNITYISMLSNAISNAIDGMRNTFLKRIFKTISKPIVRFYHFRLKHRYYTFYTDLALIKYIRNKIFYRSHIRIK